MSKNNSKSISKYSFKYNSRRELVLERASGRQIPLRQIVRQIARQAEKEPPGPFYLYNIEGLRGWLQLFLKTLSPPLEVFYSMKANNNREVLKVFLEEGSGADVVSGGEARRALEARFPPEKIVFSGVGKTAEELKMAIEKGFLQINGESLEELKIIAREARRLGKKAPLGLRINPDVDFDSHPYIKTGLKGHKFGFEEEDLPAVLDFIRSRPKELSLKGLSMHIGSQIFDLEPFFRAARGLMALYGDLKKEGFPLEIMDLGGGFGVDYRSHGLSKEGRQLKSLKAGLKKTLKGFSGRVLSEPGRFLTARFGLLCARVIYIKKSPGRQFAILESGMSHFLRPALYGAVHRILPFSAPKGRREIYDVVGPVCETGDTFARGCALPPLKAGDWLAIADTGAYGYVMANSYNLQPPIREIPYPLIKPLF